MFTVARLTADWDLSGGSTAPSHLTFQLMFTVTRPRWSTHWLKFWDPRSKRVRRSTLHLYISVQMVKPWILIPSIEYASSLWLWTIDPVSRVSHDFPEIDPTRSYSIPWRLGKFYSYQRDFFSDSITPKKESCFISALSELLTIHLFQIELYLKLMSITDWKKNLNKS